MDKTKLPESVAMVERLEADYVAHWKPHLDEEDYHKDLTAIARGDLLAIEKSPRSWLQYRNDKHNPEAKKPPSDPLRIGRAVHCKLLESARFDRLFVKIPDFGDQRSPRNKAAKNDWLSEQGGDAILCTESEHAMIVGMVESFLKHPIAEKIFLKNTVVEQACYFRDPETGFKCRVKPDFVSEAFQAVVDFKSTIDASMDAFSRAILSHRYDVQGAFYGAGVANVVPWPVRAHIICAVEKKAPYECAVYTLNEASLEYGAMTVRACMDRIDRALKQNQFNPYQQEAEDISIPHWAFQSADEYFYKLRR